jgi:hypothetical protein
MRTLPISLVAATAVIATAGAALAHPPDLTRLPLGDNLLADAPEVGHIVACRTNPDAGGAFRDGDWIDMANGTWNLLEKVSVEGSVVLSGYFFEYGVDGGERSFVTADIPEHPTGTFPVAANDPAYQFDRNPNTIAVQDFAFAIPADPVVAPEPGCAPGSVGVLLSGVVLFNALDAPGRDAVAHETQDLCQGHPQGSGVYHYHSGSPCVIDAFDTGEGHSALIGYILDGFGIYGRRGEDGIELSSDDLDECHGHTHVIEWDGRTVEMYHYHATQDFPYTVGCMRGQYENDDVMMISGGESGGGQPRRP